MCLSIFGQCGHSSYTDSLSEYDYANNMHESKFHRLPFSIDTNTNKNNNFDSQQSEETGRQCLRRIFQWLL
jgi:hypothetical protein